MKKRVLSLALVISIIASLFVAMPMTASAYYGSYNNGTLYYDISNNQVTITDCVDSVSGSLTIPSTLSGYPVTSIGANAFNDYYLTSITIPSSVTSIGDYAFFGCTSLTSITIPDSVISIGEYAFGNTEWYYNQPDGVVYAGKVAYEYKGTMPSNTSITIKDGTLGIANEAFWLCSDLLSITIPDSVTSIGDYAFYYCSSLTSITIPNSVTSIGDYAFSYCESLTSITIPSSVKSIGESALEGCYSLVTIYVDTKNKKYSSQGNVLFNKNKTTLICCPVGKTGEYTIPSSVTSIGNGAFDCCYSITAIVIPGSVTRIGDSAFFYCNSLTSITIPDSVTSIGDSAFFDCSNLTSITIPNSVTSVGGHAFYNTAWYNNQPDGLVYAGKVAYEYKGTMPSNTSITIKDGTLGITAYAFDECSSLTSITIPNSVTSIGEYAFYGCSSLTSITIQDSVTSIGYYAFVECSSLKDVYLQKGANISVGSNNSYYDEATKHYYEYLIYYDTKGGTISNCYQPVDDATLDVVLSSEIPEKDGFGFLGWSLSANADSVDYEAGENIGTISDNITLYAVFDNNLKVNSYEIFANQIKFNVDTLITDSKESYSLYAIGYDEAGMITALSKEALDYGKNQTEISLDNANKVSTYKITVLSDRFMPIADAASGEMSVN